MTSTIAAQASTPPPSGRLIPCQTRDPELWFAETPEGLDYAKSLCRACPLRQTCLDGALDRGEPWGVWGAEILSAGRVIPRKLVRGRPRKDMAA